MRRGAAGWGWGCEGPEGGCGGFTPSSGRELHSPSTRGSSGCSPPRRPGPCCPRPGRAWRAGPGGAAGRRGWRRGEGRGATGRGGGGQRAAGGGGGGARPRAAAPGRARGGGRVGGRRGRRPSRPGPGAAGGAAGRAALALRGGLRSARGSEAAALSAAPAAAAAGRERGSDGGGGEEGGGGGGGNPEKGPRSPGAAAARPGSAQAHSAPCSAGGPARRPGPAPAPPLKAPFQISPSWVWQAALTAGSTPPAGCGPRALCLVYRFRPPLETPAPDALASSHPEFTHPNLPDGPVVTFLSPKLFPSSPFLLTCS